MSVQEYMELPYNTTIKPIKDESGSYFHTSVLDLMAVRVPVKPFRRLTTAFRSD